MRLGSIVLAAALVAVPLLTASTAVAQTAAAAPGAPHRPRNWTPLAYKIYAQTLCDQIMAKHPELISTTFHGVPPGLDKVYTMFAGSSPDRIGNTDDPDDVDVSVKGITIIDPRWRRNDPAKKFVVMMPLRNAAHENIGLIVFAYKSPPNDTKSEISYFTDATAIRDGLEPKIPTYGDLFKPAG